MRRVVGVAIVAFFFFFIC